MELHTKFNTVVISTYTFIYDGIRNSNSGPVVPLINYFVPRAETLYLLEQPLPGSDFTDTRVTVFHEGKTEEKIIKNHFSPWRAQKRLNSNKTYIGLKIRDVFSNFTFLADNYKHLKADLFIGLECINALFGVFLKHLGLAKKVVYYIFDWAPDRYKNPLMNNTYIWLDKMATYHCDYTWNITYTIEEAKKNILNFSPKKMSRQLYVPYCVDFDKRRILKNDEINGNLIVYAGGLIEENGPQILIEAFRIILERFPEAKLLIIGGGHMEAALRNRVSVCGMDGSVEITGYIKEDERVTELQRRGAVGVAPYPIIKGSRKPFGDVIKIRVYFSCGLPVVSTPVPPVTKEIAQERLGLVTENDSPESLAAAISTFLSDKDFLYQTRERVIEKAMKSTWDENFNSALKEMEY
ncbi:MAG: glycosyltransferase [Nitrospirae bacterium YQR-1]